MLQGRHIAISSIINKNADVDNKMVIWSGVGRRSTNIRSVLKKRSGQSCCDLQKEPKQ